MSVGTAKQQEEQEKTANIPLTWEMISIGMEKGGLYDIILAFQPGNTPLPQFEEELRSNFTGEIEILCDGRPYQTIRYEDFVGFAPAPLGNGYGPVYRVKIDVPAFVLDKQYDFYPRIRARTPCGYSFAIARRQGVGAWLQGLFSSPGRQKTAAAPRSDLQAMAHAERLDILLEIEGRYGFGVGFRQLEHEKDLRIVDFRETFRKHKGAIEILQDGNRIKILNYNSNAYSGIGRGVEFSGYGYSLYNVQPGWYSFIPKIMSSEMRTFAFDIVRAKYNK